MTLFNCILWFVVIPIGLNVYIEFMSSKKNDNDPVFDRKSFNYTFDEFKKDMHDKNIDI